MNGVLLALVAMFGWGFADFYAQRSARKVGNVTTLFSGSLLGFIVLLPSSYGQLDLLAGHPRLVLLIAIGAAVAIFTALFSLEAYRRGKLAVVEPIMGLELPFTVLLAVALYGEHLGVPQALAMTAIFLGVVLTAAAGGDLPSGKKMIERGALLGLVGVFGLGALNFLTAVISQEASPVLAVWSGRAVVCLVIGAYLVAKGRVRATFQAMREHPALVFSVSALYLAAFMAYGTAVTLIPIAVATAISEGYIVLTVLLGVFFNKERLVRHQIFGAAISLAGILALAYASA
jgi:drug/metabolite transporter (DMT)-like permease